VPIHPTAVVDPHAEIDPTVEVGPFCVIEANVRVAANCRLYQGVYLTGWTEIGEGCELHPGAIVGHTPQDVKFENERSFCRVGPRTIIREYTTIHRGTMPESETRIGSDCFLMGTTHVAHNCQIGDHVVMMNDAKLAGHVQVGPRATISGGVVVHQFVRIGELAMIQGNGGIGMDILPFSLAALDGRIAGINIIGLRRAGFSAEEQKEIRDAFRLLYRSRLPFSEAVEQVTDQLHTEPGRRLLEFLKSESKRGFAGRHRRRAQ
jgi:UDP-N-acetylglucosamine acyltransferase